MYNNFLKTLFLIIVIILGLTSCTSDGLYIKNNVPKAKIVLESQPNKNIFYSDTYQSVTQRIYNDNIKVFNLNIGKNEFALYKDNKNYAVYFILPNKKTTNWKYLLNSDSANEFIVNDDNIEKD